jgi:phosphohistidine phosphatase
MEILLIRHGQAVDEAPGLGDGGRWLTAKGRKITRKVARWVAKSDRRRPLSIWSSPLVRSVQTAEIFAAQASFKGEVRTLAQLTPGHDPGDLLKLLAAEVFEGPLALVGHEPSLSLIATALLGDIGFAGFKKSAVMGLTWEPPPLPPPEEETAATDHDGARPPVPPEPVGTLRFLFDPVTMKAQKRIVPKPPEPPAPPPTEA